MDFMERMTQILWIVLFVLIMFVIIACLCYVIIYKKKRKTRTGREIDDEPSLNRMDSADYVKIEDIKDDMVILENATRFVGAVKCQGFEFFMAHEVEQAATMSSFFSFIGTINQPVTYRQHSCAVDLDDTIARYQEVYSGLEEKLYNAVQDKKELISAMQKKKENMAEEELVVYAEQLEEFERQINAYTYRLRHVQDEIDYLRKNSGAGVMPEMVQLWIYEWAYNPSDFPFDLTKEQVLKKAREKLEAATNAIVYSLGNCNVKAKRLNTLELIEINRRYSSPISANRYKLSDIVSSNFFEDIVQTDDIKKNQAATMEINEEYMTEQMVEHLLNQSDEKEEE